ncbi:MAG: SprT-like domain-containing protein, partial [Gammaproteobacteria bacterium]|nr:SprT-like domain-containing protein [Gammaproteobacteria bacterium]
AVNRYIEIASQAFDRPFPELEVKFDVKGGIAGMYCRRGEQSWLRFNPFIFSKYFEENLNETVPHEVAHYIVDLVYGRAAKGRRLKPHGKEWQLVMQSFGVVPKITHDHDMDGIPVRRQSQFDYFCACRKHLVSATKHNRIQKKRWRYACVKCGETIRRRATNNSSKLEQSPQFELELD